MARPERATKTVAARILKMIMIEVIEADAEVRTERKSKETDARRWLLERVRDRGK